MVVNRAEARHSLGLAAEQCLIAVLPGSRSAELQRLTTAFLETAYCCLQKRPDCHFIAPMANEKMAALFHQGLKDFKVNLPITVIVGQARTAMAAADGVLLASGTATLEALLLKRPMVVAYAVSWVTYRVIKWLLKVKHVALSNLLTETPLVPEFIQQDICPEKMAESLLDVMSREQDFVAQFTQVHKDLRQGASARAAEVLVSLVQHDNH
jgi:lipid-A-disaccharide synthase